MHHGFTLRFTLRLFFFLGLLLPIGLLAQRPLPVTVPKIPAGYQPSQGKMDCNDAGEIEQFTGFQMNSTSFGNNPLSTDVRPFSARPDTIFLCAQDQFTVQHRSGSEDLTGDPDPTTTPGVGYAFYRCRPMITGPTLLDIAADSCVANNGESPFDTLAITVPPAYLTGDFSAIIANDGTGSNTIPALFPQGNMPSPVVLTLAPITFDHVNPMTDRAFYEGDPTGNCVNVATDQTFTVAYLNPVTVANLGVNANNTCEGLFDVRGGTPELLGGTGYDITIEEVNSGARAVITTPQEEIVHNAVVNYTVPEAGEYRITILDQNSCPLQDTTILHSTGCTLPLVVNFPFATGVGGTNVCVPITVENFTDIVGFQFDIGFDSTLLQFTGIRDQNMNLTGAILTNGPPSSNGNLPDGIARIFYGDTFSGPSTVPNGGVLFEACFDVIGPFGSQSPLRCLTADDFPGVSIPASSTRTGNDREMINCVEGAFSVTDEAFLLELAAESEVCDEQNDGRVLATASGAPAPFTFAIRQLMPAPEVLFRDDRTRTNNPATAEFSGLSPGEYEVRAISGTDTVFGTITVADAPPLSVNIGVFTEPSCNGFSDGVVFARIGGGIVDPVGQGFVFTWERTTPSGDTVFTETSDTLRNIPAGLYRVTVRTPEGCTAVDETGDLDEPIAININETGIVDAACNTAENGSITVNATGGNGAPYDFNWTDPNLTDNSGTTSGQTMLGPGFYEVIATDSRGCSDTAVFEVDTVRILGITAVVDSVTCFDDADGQIAVTGTSRNAFPVGDYFVRIIDLQTGGEGPEMRIIDDSTPFPFPGLDTGRYVIVLRDEDPLGCEVQDTFRISQPDLLEIGMLDIRNETCPVGMDGRVMIPVSGGTEPYAYQVVNDSLMTPLDTTLLMGNTLDGLSADTNYVVIVTDANMCTDTVRFRINAPAGAQLLPIDTSFVSCPGDTDGQLAVNATPPPGETITSIVWNRLNPDGSIGERVANTATTDDNLTVGTYVVTVTTSNTCTAQAFGIVDSPGLVFLASTVVNDPQCPGDANGSIFVNPGGGTPNADGTYNYVLTTPEDPFGGLETTNPVFTNLPANEYTLVIRDRNNCQPAFDTTFVLRDPPSITGTFALDPVSCPDDTTRDGRATFTAEFSDGSPGVFDFLWTSGTADFSTTSSTETGLGRGPVTVRVTDGVCTESFMDTIRSPEDFAVTLMTTDVSCNGLMDGSVSATVTGGTADYDFSWSVSPDNASTITDLPAGTMLTLDITDANGCMAERETFTIREPDPLTLTIDPAITTPAVRCAGDANGVVGTFISSVNNNELPEAPYTWSNNVAPPDAPTARDLPPGTYSVTVTDIEGCQDSVTVTIGEPEPITFSVLPIEEPLCFGETTPVLIDTAFGGTSRGIDDFTFSVNNDGFRIPVGQTGSAFAGDVLVTVFDSLGCSAEQTFSVNQPPPIVIDLPEEIIVELGDSLTQLNPLVSPAGDVYQYQWSPGDFLSSDTVRNPTLVLPTNSQDYTLQVTNANGCLAFADIFVAVDANRNVYIPNIFSPNRDGRNEDFRIFACQGVRRVRDVRVFNRWGGVVFEATDLPPNCLDGIQLWDGTGLNGRPVNAGVFVYTIEVEFLDNVTLLYRGDITVVR